MKAGETLEAIVEPAVTGLGYEFVGAEYLPQGRHSVLRIFIDHEDGITVDDCSRVSHQVSAVLDVEDPIKGQYSLEISSPGLDRPLFTPAHYERFAGSEVQLRLRAPIEGRRKFKGLLKGLRDSTVIVEVDGEEWALPWEDIDKANLVPKW